MPRLGCVLLIAIFLLEPAWSARVELPMGPEIMGAADFHDAGPASQPVLILHGFLQTSAFRTVQRLHDSLAEEGYTVLSPTLSLGIDRREQSLSCEAVHLRTLGQDAAEVGKWVDWLYQRYHKPVVLIGHSAGGQVLTRYLHDNPHAPVAKLIMISLDPVAGSPPKHPTAAGIQVYSLGYCRRFPATPRVFDSYADWGLQKMLQTLHANASITTVILGSADKRIALDTIKALHAAHVQLIEVPGARHFFDNQYEFDLLDVVERLLRAKAH